MAVQVLRIYREPTQWAADVEIDGARHQLTFPAYALDGPGPTENEVLFAAETLAALQQSPYELVGEDGNVIL